MINIKITDVRCDKGDSAFLLDDGKTAILYDTGFGFTGFEVAKNIKNNLGDRPLDYIFLTHSHYDHALGSAYILRHYPDAKVVAGAYAVDIFKRDGAKRTMKELDSKHAEKCGVYDYEFLGDELRVDIPVNDDDIVNAGDMSFEVLYLPGHTRCCVGYFCKEKGLLLSNETLGVYDGKETIVPSYLVSYKDSISSIERVEKLDISYILAPHYGILSKEQSEFFLGNMKKASRKVADDILISLKNGKSDGEIIADFKARYWHGYIKEIYPEDAVNLNTSIMIGLIRKELL
ncbi:MAG: MBL fold metallo-hydrolase [Ruminococcaceae bacterium]|nr:MBL fold metallo-hydrolase [Oscillospiraceae bacterium]